MGFLDDDPFFGPATIDRDEWRDQPRRHRYVHGSFEGTDTRFSLYLPPDDVYAGRTLHFLQGGFGGSEKTLGRLPFGLDLAAEHGAVLVESNQGHIGQDLSGLKGDQTILLWRASAQTSRFARRFAEEAYGTAPHHNYLYGGSGGAARSIAGMENAPGLWDGAVPFMTGSNPYFLTSWTYLALMRSLLDREGLAAVVDAVDPGGSGNPFAILPSIEQRQALAALYRAGYPRGAEFLMEEVAVWIFSMTSLAGTDPGYFSDFWTVDGYEGADAGGPVAARRVQRELSVQRVVRAADIPGYGTMSDDVNIYGISLTPPDTPVGIVVEGLEDPAAHFGSTLRLTSGAAQGRSLLCTGAVGDVLAAALDATFFAGVEAGDRVMVDNSNYLAWTYYHRHLAHPSFPEMAQWFVDGEPLFTQRPRLDLTKVPEPDGRYEGKLILLQHTLDRECWPYGAVRYDQALTRRWGDSAGDHFRLWWVENASHFPPAPGPWASRLINYAGHYAAAIGDLIRWVEDGVAPPPSTAYEYDGECRLTLPPTIAERGGIQPVVTATVDGGVRAEVKLGETVLLAGAAELPSGVEIVREQWDIEGNGEFSLEGAEVKHSYASAGTFFATYRVTARRIGDPSTTALLQNLARVRVVVSE